VKNLRNQAWMALIDNLSQVSCGEKQAAILCLRERREKGVRLLKEKEVFNTG
jgi:hypothetical protein